MEAQSGRSIFILDSDPHRGARIARLFQDGGVAAVHETSPSAAFKAMAAHPPAMLVARLGLVSGNDFAFLRALRNNGALAGLPVLVAANDEAKSTAALQAGATQFIAESDPIAVYETACKALPGEVCAGTPPTPRPDTLHELYARGCRRLKQERYAEAVSDFKQIIKVKPNAPELLVSLAVALRHLGKAQAAVQYLQRASVLFALAGKDAKAKDIHDQLAQNDPTTDNPFLLLAGQWLEEGRPIQAMKLYERAAGLWPRNIDLKRSLLAVYEELTETDLKYASLAEVLTLEINELLGGPSASETEEWLPDEEEALGEGAMQFVDETDVRKGVEERRRAPRVPLVSHSLRYSKTRDALPAVDISLTGIGFKPLDEKFEEGQLIHFDLASMGEVEIKKLAAKVMRVTPHIVGAQFEELSPKQRARLEKLCEG
ncbi:PilZ domain-containing protein [Oceanidesulfovibrio marinus]|uniref:Tetratricopeptide repeat protein n=1 Tax=Oceanidesulfovibrio marinus TaxID=370038 RepID=A0ABX6NLR1_9BACT|nr:PilZ domain-containing protein [Oceanidesulfovibrio marinus]QJT11049.1 tetratricopeptide repeat protein [Oceanidesulfovibrio marinus]